MDEEKMRILQMIQDGTISAEEGAKLLTALESSRAAEEAKVREATSNRWLRLRLTSSRTGANKINFNIPLSLVEIALKFGDKLNLFEAIKGKDIDIEQISNAIRSGTVGKILDVEDNEGEERVEIYIE
jgi:hypothetical protein